MVALNSRDRLQPSLLDRLIDAEPRQKAEGADARALTRHQLRSAVLRDLSWLFNATRDEPDAASQGRDAEIAMWHANDEARRSVLNYGMPAFAGTTLASLDTSQIENGIAEAIRNFEPRIDPGTLQVEVRAGTGDVAHNTMQIVIRGQMWAQPVPLELLLSADMDVETGHTQVREMNR